MMLFTKRLLCLLALTSLSAEALPSVVVAPQCLSQHLTGHYQTLATQGSLTLVSVDETGLEALMQAKDQQKTPCGGFMNVTDAWQQKTRAGDANHFLSLYMPSAKSTRSIANSGYHVAYPTEVNQALKLLNPEDMWSKLTTLTQYPDRFANSDTGVQAAQWIKTTVEAMAKTYGRQDVQVYFVTTGSSFSQPSVVAKIGSSMAPGVVVSGHLDTLKKRFANLPGADDDGSGSVSVLEATRTILASQLQFKKPIYMIWYAAEEEGLVGSQHVVANFKEQNIPVANVLHFDMTGYTPKNDPTMWVMDDYTNKDLTSFLASLITTYVKVPVQHTKCGYDCSDHASWHLQGYPASIATEAEFGKYDPYLHTPQDTMSLLSMQHMANFARLATAFAIELAEPVSNKRRG
jgi:leucyl aminopeptidase